MSQLLWYFVFPDSFSEIWHQSLFTVNISEIHPIVFFHSFVNLPTRLIFGSFYVQFSCPKVISLLGDIRKINRQVCGLVSKVVIFLFYVKLYADFHGLSLGTSGILFNSMCWFGYKKGYPNWIYIFRGVQYFPLH